MGCRVKPGNDEGEAVLGVVFASMPSFRPGFAAQADTQKEVGIGPATDKLASLYFAKCKLIWRDCSPEELVNKPKSISVENVRLAVLRNEGDFIGLDHLLYLAAVNSFGLSR